MTASVGLYPTSVSVVATGGQPITLMYGPLLGGIIVNPATPADQGLTSVEVLYIDIVGPAAAAETATTVAVQPGQSYTVPAISGNVSVNAATSGHRFTAIALQPFSPAVPGQVVGATNPCLQEIIPSYLYQQYTDDQDLQAFVAAYNAIAQQYLDWLNDTPLPVYTSPAISGALLDWVALGLYGVARPTLSARGADTLGPFDTYHLDEMAFAARRTVGPASFAPVNDDFFKRILTWKLYKGDDKVINVKWLKRRVLRFLLGGDGSDVDAADTQKISVTFGGNVVTITVVDSVGVLVDGGPLYNSQVFNGMGFNSTDVKIRSKQTIDTYQRDNQVNINFLSQQVTGITGTSFNTFLGNGAVFNGFAPTGHQTFSPLPNIAVFKEAVDQGVLDMPFQFNVDVSIR